MLGLDILITVYWGGGELSRRTQYVEGLAPGEAPARCTQPPNQRGVVCPRGPAHAKPPLRGIVQRPRAVCSMQISQEPTGACLHRKHRPQHGNWKRTSQRPPASLWDPVTLIPVPLCLGQLRTLAAPGTANPLVLIPAPAPQPV